MFDPAAIADDPMTQLMELLFTAGPVCCGERDDEHAGGDTSDRGVEVPCSG